MSQNILFKRDGLSLRRRDSRKYQMTDMCFKDQSGFLIARTRRRYDMPFRLSSIREGLDA